MFKILFIFLSLIYVSTSIADETVVAVENTKLDVIKTRIENIIITIEQTNAQLAKKIISYKNAEDASYKIQQQTEITQIRSKLNELNQSFDTLSAGGLQFSNTPPVKTRKLDWQNDLMEIIKPLFTALKDLTQKPREIDNLRRLIERYDEQIILNKQALEHIVMLEKTGLNKVTLARLKNFKENRSQKMNDAIRQKNVANYQLEEKLSDKESVLDITNKKLKAFITGTGFTLLLAVITFTSIMLIGNIFQKKLDKKAKSKQLKFSQRLRRIIFKAATTIIAVLCLLLVFYLRNDWLFMGLSFIFLLGAAFSLKNTLPQYINEIKMLLDISTVREGERVIYNGIPWKVKKLNFHSKLVNPDLRGGTIRMSLKQLADLHSRSFNADEPWFPCKEGDYIVLDSGMGQYGQVLVATPESVQIETYGGSIITYPTANFLTLNPRNLSTQSFAIRSEFGIDYSLQDIATTKILVAFQAEINEQILNEEYGPYLTHLEVEFNIANTSSLDYKIIAHFDGKAAKHYYNISGDLQMFAVNVCNKHSWNIPFQQLVIHSKEH